MSALGALAAGAAIGLAVFVASLRVFRLGRRVGRSDAEAGAAAYLLSERAEILGLVEEAVNVCMWMSAAEEFGVGGKAHKGWEKARDRLHVIDQRVRALRRIGS